MKTAWVFVLVLVLVILFHAFKSVQSSVITGKIVPAHAVNQVVAIQGKDSLKAIPDKGIYTLQARPGTYTLIIDFKDPIEDMVIEAVKVNERKTTYMKPIQIIQ